MFPIFCPPLRGVDDPPEVACSATDARWEYLPSDQSFGPFERVHALFGWPPDAPLGFSQLAGCLHPDDLPAFARLHDAAREGRPAEAELRVLLDTREVRPVWARIEALRHEGEVVRYRYRMVDLTCRRQARPEPSCPLGLRAPEKGGV